MLSGSGLVLREWRDSDVTSMVTLFDEPSIDAWTPLAAPFRADEARRYMAQAHAAREHDRGLQLAITVQGERPLGEVLLFYAPDGVGELAYAVGVEHRGSGLAARAVRLLVDYAHNERGMASFLLRIAADNAPSQRVAAACGFSLTSEPIVIRERKGRRVELMTWRRTLDG